MNSLLSAIKAFVLKNRPAYKDYLGNGKYDVKKLPEECVPDSVNNNIRTAQNKADSAYDKANLAYSEAESAYDRATLAYDKANEAQSTANEAQSTANEAIDIGRKWMKPDGSANGIQFNNIIYADGIWVGGTTNGVRHSFDGKKWIDSELAFSNDYRITYNEGTWIASSTVDGDAKSLEYSKDGIHWKNTNTPVGKYRVKACNSRWFAWNTIKTLYSDDGISWYESLNESISDITYMDNVYVACGDTGFYYSDNGKTWTKAEYADWKSESGYSLTYANGLCLATPFSISDNVDRMIAYTTDGKIWASSDLENYGYSINVNGIWFSCCSNTRKHYLYYSADGKTWTKTSIPSYSEAYYLTTSMTYGHGLYIAVGDGIRYSQDGINWNVSNMGYSSSFKNIISVYDMFIAVGAYGIVYSKDGKNWETAVLPSNTSKSYKDIVYANGMLQALANNTWGLVYSERMLALNEDLNLNIKWIKNRIGRVFVTGTIVNKNGINYIAIDQTKEQIRELYNSGKEVVLEIAKGEDDVMRASYNGTLFYLITVMSAGDTINSIGLMVFGEPMIDGQRTLWAIGQFELMGVG